MTLLQGCFLLLISSYTIHEHGGALPSGTNWRAPPGSLLEDAFVESAIFTDLTLDFVI